MGVQKVEAILFKKSVTRDLYILYILFSYFSVTNRSHLVSLSKAVKHMVTFRGDIFLHWSKWPAMSHEEVFFSFIVLKFSLFPFHFFALSLKAKGEL